jgi:Transposase DDE domain
LELCRRHNSKERRVDPQIVVGLLVDRTGFPLEIGCFEGNTAETTTIVPIVTNFIERHGLARTPMVVAADAGMLSASNLKDLDAAGLSFIVGSRTTKAPGDLASHFHWNGDVFTDGQIIDTVTPRHGNTKVNDPALRAEPVWNPQTHTGAWRRSGRIRPNGHAATKRPSMRRRPVRGRSWTATRRLNQRGSSKPGATIAAWRSRPGPGTIPDRAQGLCHQRQRRGDALRRSDHQVPRSLACREVLPHVEDRPTGPTNVPPSARGDRGAPDDSVHRPGRRARHPDTGVAIGKVVKQLRPLRSATIVINGAQQDFPPEIPQAQRKILTHLGFKPGY